MIKSFREEETRKVFSRQRSSRLPPNIQQVALRKLRMLNNAHSMDDLRVPPGNRLERLSGARSGQHGIRINDRWRVCFEWREGDADGVEFVDYQ